MATGEDVIRRKLLGLLGLGLRGRLVVVGVQQVRDAVMRGKVKLAFVAPDASQNSRAKVIPLLTARKIRFVESLTAAELGGVGGREQTAAVGVVDGQLAKGMREVLESASTGAQ